eukprot:COSAG01_NODE_26879_length_700_cov_1.193012_1_plen_141_part_10
MGGTAGLLAGGLGLSLGTAGGIGSQEIYVLLVCLNIVGMFSGSLAFSAQPGLCENEAPPPPHTKTTLRCERLVACCLPVRLPVFLSACACVTCSHPVRRLLALAVMRRHCRAAPDTPWAEGRTCAAVGSCLSNFRHPPFAA